MSGSISYTFEDGTTPVNLTLGVSTTPANTTGFGTSYSVLTINGAVGTTPINGELGQSGQAQTFPTDFDNAIFTSPSSGATIGQHSGSSYGLDYAGLLFATAAGTYNLYYDSISNQFMLTNETTQKTEVATLVQTNAPCYCPGTLLTTDRGEMPVEALSIGAVLITATGQRRPIRWIGRRAYAGRFLAANPHVQPVRFRAGSLGGGLPRRDLVVSPDHAMFVDGVLIPARCLVNGATVVRERGLPQVEYIHVELDAHDVILAEGAPSESFLDDGSRAMFQNAAECTAAGSDPVSAETFCAPRMDSGPLVDAAHRRLASLAEGAALAA